MTGMLLGQSIPSGCLQTNRQGWQLQLQLLAAPIQDAILTECCVVMLLSSASLGNSCSTV